VEAAEYNHLVKEAFRCYRETLPEISKVLVDRYEIKDVAIKIVGVGSVGTRCAILLMMTGDDDPLFLQVKEVHESVLEAVFRKSVYQCCGQRVVAGQRLMQAASDMFWAGRNNGDGIFTYGSYVTLRSNRSSKFSIRVFWQTMENGVEWATRPSPCQVGRRCDDQRIPRQLQQIR